MNRIYSTFVRYFMLAGCLIGLSQPLTAHNRIVYLIANPRTCMVEFLRMIHARDGDFKVMHIPANWAYCHVNNYLDIVKGWYREDAPTSYVEACQTILQEAETAPVFVGENTHTAVEFLAANESFKINPQVQYICLLGEPHKSVISYYEKKKNYFDELPRSQMSKSMGLKDLYELTLEFEAKNLPKPLFLKSEDLYYNTEETVKRVCQYLDIPFKEESLHWQDLSENFTSFPGWYTIELTDCAKTWHLPAISSTGFTKPASYELDASGRPTFAEIDNPEHREICRQAYEENLVYYNLLLAKV
jgi:Sulfotransferase domain